MIQTSNFATCMHHPNAVSIAGKCPDGFMGRQYRKLATYFWFFDHYKKTGDTQHYIKHYTAEVLDVLDPQSVYDDLNDGLDGAILLCFEKRGDFCHRRLVANWLETKLGVLVPEYVKAV